MINQQSEVYAYTPVGECTIAGKSATLTLQGASMSYRFGDWIVKFDSSGWFGRVVLNVTYALPKGLGYQIYLPGQIPLLRKYLWQIVLTQSDVLSFQGKVRLEEASEDLVTQQYEKRILFSFVGISPLSMVKVISPAMPIRVEVTKVEATNKKSKRMLRIRSAAANSG